MVTAPTADEEALVGAHLRYLTELRDRGVLILAGRTQDDNPFGIVIFESDEERDARQIVAGDPAVAAGVFAMTLHPYAVAVAREPLTPPS